MRTANFATDALTPARPFKDVVTAHERARRFREAGWWTGATLAQRVGDHSRHRPDNVAVIDRMGARKRTYRELGEDVTKVLGLLRQCGVRTGDVVSIQLPNCYEAVVASVAAQAAGAVINPILPNYRGHELTHIFTTARPRAIFTPLEYRNCDYVSMIEDIRRETRTDIVHIVVDDGGHGGDVNLQTFLERPAALHPDSPLLSSAVSEVIFTSGTEGQPKAVMHTEETANFAVRTAFSDLGLESSQIVWMPSPVGHSTGFNYGTRAALYHGLTIVLQDRWSASDALELIQRFNCSYTLAATTFLTDLVGECERTGANDLMFSHFGCGGAPVPPETVDRARNVGIDVLRLYGATEFLCATWNRPTSPWERRLSTDGPALSHTEIAFLDENEQVDAKATSGEILVRGPNVSVGFYRDERRTKATYLEDGWVRSGDLGELTDDGHLTIVGRKKEIIIRGGMNVTPREIEELITAFREVAQVAVVGVPDPRLGERTCACVVLHTASTLDLQTTVTRLTEAGLASYKLPEDLRVVTALPMTASGKVQKHELVRSITD